MFAALAATAELDAVELDALRDDAAKRSKANKTTVNKVLKEARAEQTRQQAKQQAQQRAASRTDPRPIIDCPSTDAPWLPEMAKINDVLGLSSDGKPPLRDIEDGTSRARKQVVPDTHAFTHETEEDDDD